MPTGMPPGGAQMQPVPPHSATGPMQMNPGLGPHGHSGILVPSLHERDHIGGPPMGPPMMHHGPHVGIPVSSHPLPGPLPHHPHHLHPHQHPSMPMHRMPFIGQPELRIYEMNRRLQQRGDESDGLWWDSFASDFFEDDATITILVYMEDGPKRYTIGRILIPRYFRSIFESGCGELFFNLRMPRESPNPHHLTLDSECVQVMNMNRPPGISVYVEGRLTLEFTFEELRIRSWTFNIRNFREMDPATFEHISKNITRCGITMNTLNFLRMCVILEPMQELMSRQKAYSLSPRDCLKTTLFQKWQRMLAPQGQPMKTENKQPSKRRKRKGSSANSDSGSGSGRGSKRKQSPGPLPVPNIAQPGEVMIVGEPTLMGGDFGDEDERRITRLENTQFDPNCTSSGLQMPQHPLAVNSSGGGPIHPMSHHGQTHHQMINQGNMSHMHGNIGHHVSQPGGSGPMHPHQGLGNQQMSHASGNKPPMMVSNSNNCMPQNQFHLMSGNPGNQSQPMGGGPHNFHQMSPNLPAGHPNNNIPPHLIPGGGQVSLNNNQGNPGQLMRGGPTPPMNINSLGPPNSQQQQQPPQQQQQQQQQQPPQQVAASSFSGPNTPVSSGSRGNMPLSSSAETNASSMFSNSMSVASGGPIGPPPRSSSASGVMMGPSNKAPHISNVCGGNMSSNSSPLMPTSGASLRSTNGTPPPQLHYHNQHYSNPLTSSPLVIPQSNNTRSIPSSPNFSNQGSTSIGNNGSVPSNLNELGTNRHIPSGGPNSVPASNSNGDGRNAMESCLLNDEMAVSKKKIENPMNWPPNANQGPDSNNETKPCVDSTESKIAPNPEKLEERFEDIKPHDQLSAEQKPKISCGSNDTPPPLERNELSDIMDIN